MEVYSLGFFRVWSSHYYVCFGCVPIKTQVLETSNSLSLQFLPINTCVFLVDWNFDEDMDIQHNHIWRETCFISITLGIRGVRFQGLQPFFKEHENSDIDIAVLNIGYRCIHGFKKVQIYWKFKFKNLCYLCYPFFWSFKDFYNTPKFPKITHWVAFFDHSMYPCGFTIRWLLKIPAARPRMMSSRPNCRRRWMFVKTGGTFTLEVTRPLR